MGLDGRGILSVVEIIFYIPVLVVSAILVLRHGFKRDLGWIFLFIFANGKSLLLMGCDEGAYISCVQ